MAHFNITPSKIMPNPITTFPPYADEEKTMVTAMIEVNTHTINKYEVDSATGHLVLDRVGYSTLSYPVAYAGIPQTFDEDGDPLDVVIAQVTETLIPGSIVRARIIGVMKFVDGGEVDDKIVTVLADDKRMDGITTYEDLGEYFEKEITYYFEHYKDLKKPGTCKVEGFYGIDEAKKIIDESIERYKKEYAPLIKE